MGILFIQKSKINNHQSSIDSKDDNATIEEWISE